MKRVVVYQRYMELLNYVLEKFNVHVDDKEKINSHMDNFQVPDISGGEVNFSLQVQRPHPINWKAKGKIFEIFGSNMRNKTTTLLFAASLLGIDWNDVAPFIKDQKLIDQAKVILEEISNGVTANLSLENSKYRFEVRTEKAIATTVWWDKTTNNHDSRNGINLSSEVDWKAYREAVGSHFDVQVVVSRNFITQVGYEEASNLANFCSEVCDYIINYSSLLLGEKPKGNAVILRYQITELEQKIKAIRNNIKEAMQNKNATEVTVQQMQSDLIALEKIFKMEEVKDALLLSSKQKQAVELQKRLKDGKLQAVQVAQRIKTLEDVVAGRTEKIENLQQILEKLSIELEINRGKLDIPDLPEVIYAVNNIDITSIVKFINRLNVDEYTNRAQEQLASSVFSGISLSTKLLGLFYFDKHIKNLADFQESMKASAMNSKVLYSLKQHFDSLVNTIEALGYTTTKNYTDDLVGIEALKGDIGSQKEVLKQLDINNNSLEKELNELLPPYIDVSHVRQAAMDAWERVDSQIIAELERITMTSEPEFEVIADLAENIKRLSQEIQGFEIQLSEAKVQLSKYNNKLHGFKVALDKAEEESDIDERVNALRSVKNFFKNILEYWTYRRAHVQKPQNVELVTNYRSNQNNLDSDFNMVIQLINDSIKERCPFAFVHDSNGKVVKRKVLEFDFLNNTFQVENLDRAAHYHGGIQSSMTVYGLATKRTGAEFGSILLVDEWGDVGVYKDHVFQALSEIEHLAMAVFVDVDEKQLTTEFKVRR